VASSFSDLAFFLLLGARARMACVSNIEQLPQVYSATIFGDGGEQIEGLAKSMLTSINAIED
jgi:hypothetical protein